MSVIIPQLLAFKIKDLCKNKSISVEQMLNETGLDESSVTDLDKGFMPSVNTVFAIAKYFDVSVDYLLDRLDHRKDIFFIGLEPGIKYLRECDEKRQALKSEVLSSDLRSIFQTLLSYVQPDDLFNIISMAVYDLLDFENLNSFHVIRGEDRFCFYGTRENGEVVDLLPSFK